MYEELSENIPHMIIVEIKQPEDFMSERLVIDGNAVYEIDEDCMRQQEARRRGRQRGRGDCQACQKKGQKTNKGC